MKPTYQWVETAVNNVTRSGTLGVRWHNAC